MQLFTEETTYLFVSFTLQRGDPICQLLSGGRVSVEGQDAGGTGSRVFLNDFIEVDQPSGSFQRLEERHPNVQGPL